MFRSALYCVDAYYSVLGHSCCTLYFGVHLFNLALCQQRVLLFAYKCFVCSKRIVREGNRCLVYTSVHFATSSTCVFPQFVAQELLLVVSFCARLPCLPVCLFFRCMKDDDVFLVSLDLFCSCDSDPFLVHRCWLLHAPAVLFVDVSMLTS